jgi:tRNA modification GTPase
MIRKDTIVAPATPEGYSALAIIRMSGEKSWEIIEKVFTGYRIGIQPNTIVYGHIKNKEEMIDEVMVSFFRGPKSYTGEDMIEITSHGSPYIVNKIIRLLVQKGAKIAEPGEFTLRAFYHQKIDLTQAEAIIDLIHSESEAQHKVAIHQLKGGIKKEIARLREKLVRFASLIELELDFSEEDVDFADRKELLQLLENSIRHIQQLLSSFHYGVAIKQGIPVAIVGEPNVGKSTLLNRLLKEEKAIVSEIAGTTRDIIEDEINLGAYRFRFIDTAGLRSTRDKIEKIGIEKAKEKIKEATIILHLVEATQVKNKIREILDFYNDMTNKNKQYILVINKCDLSQVTIPDKLKEIPFLNISAKTGDNIEQLKEMLVSQIKKEPQKNETVITNMRHYQAFHEALTSLIRVKQGLQKNIPGDLLAHDMRCALEALGRITGEVSPDDLLDYIFSNFCIGK